jgi:hypothetical protein
VTPIDPIEYVIGGSPRVVPIPEWTCSIAECLPIEYSIGVLPGFVSYSSITLEFTIFTQDTGYAFGSYDMPVTGFITGGF